MEARLLALMIAALLALPLWWRLETEIAAGPLRSASAGDQSLAVATQLTE